MTQEAQVLQAGFFQSLPRTQGTKEQAIVCGKRTGTRLYFVNAQSYDRGLCSSRSQRLVLACLLLFNPAVFPSGNDSDIIEKASKKQELETKAKWRRGDISDPVPSTFIVSHLLATELSLLHCLIA